MGGGCQAARGAAAGEMFYACRRVQLGLPFDAIQPAPDEALSGGGGSHPHRERGSGEPRGPAFYFIRHRRARRYLLRVEHDGRVRVTIPRGGSRREAEAFARRHRRWIEEQRSRLPRPLYTVEERRAFRAQARMELPPRLMQLAAQHGLTVTRVSIRNQRTRWGSCGRDGHICLNWRLVLMPPAVRDYVLIHELMHLRRLDHSAAYWRLVAGACPGFREARQWLRLNGPALR